MPVLPTYPGVYIEEIPSGVHPITGVATSITAFVGRTSRGPVNTPTTVTSFSDFQRTFGALSPGLPMPYAVRDFYLNGGSQAVILRLFAAPAAAVQLPAPAARAAASGGTAPAPADPGTAARATPPTPPAPAAPAAALAVPSDASQTTAQAPLEANSPLALQASSAGAWGRNLGIAIDYDGIQQAFADKYNLQDTDLFNLTVTDSVSGATERFVNLTLAASPDTPRRLDRVLQRGSQLVRAATADGSPWPTGLARPAASQLGPRNRPVLTPLTGGADSRGLQAADITAGLVPALDRVDLFNLLCIPPDGPDGDTDPTVYQQALEYCYERRAMLIVDPPLAWAPSRTTSDWLKRLIDFGLSGLSARNAALYFPRLVEADPQREGQLDTYVPCGAIAGLMAQTDVQRGVWKAPAGVNATLSGVQGLSASLTDADSGVLNALGINAIRVFPVYGTVVWGARTMRGADLLADDYKYIPVRRLALFLEESLYRGLKWAVFEPNDEPLWAQIRLSVGTFMNGLFRQGAFQGGTQASAYFVKCDKDTTTQADIDLGVVNIVVGFAPLKPAEFVIVQLQQMAGQTGA